jgi:acetyl esterase/lipase
MAQYCEHHYKNNLRLLVCNCERAVAVAVFLHGGGWVGGTPLQFAKQSERLVEHRISSVSIEYRIRNRDGTSVYEALADVFDAMAPLRRMFANLPMIVVGASSGGLLAAHLAMNDRLPAAGAFLLNPVLDLSPQGFVNKATPAGGDEAISPVHLPIRSFPPTVILHGTNDRVVPLATSQQFVGRLVAMGLDAKVVSVANAAHGFFNTEQHWDHVTEGIASFILRCAAGSAQDSDGVFDC